MIRSVKAVVEAEKMANSGEIFLREGAKRSSGVQAKGKKVDQLSAYRSQIMGCGLCRLAGTRTNFVFGEGSSKAAIMFVGEAPGADEDREGRPFVGRAGQLLTKIIESIGLTREEVYIANILKCRPPENRPPMPDEIAACRGYLEKQIEMVKPRIVCALGKSSTQALLNVETPISQLRGKSFDFNGVKVIPTFHPAYLLRNPEAKKEVWEDMRKIAKELVLKLPGKKSDG
ncbi:MAG: uracil-DNA glycosylase [Candidatus Omnitrophica bacterium]|nr:uracil-DNA glycosylase [Candidatus Omnitrophota bacterium]